MDDLIAEALEDQETHPVLGLFVQSANARAIRLYERLGFAGAMEPYTDKETGVEYQKMALVLNDQALIRLRDEGTKKK
jgi:ribosomal protein S18 acetylase RimI-like enzyme